MSYKVCVRKSATEVIKKLPYETRDLILKRLTKLADDPIADDSIEITIGEPETYMTIVAGYRIGWAFYWDEDKIVVLFVDEVKD